DPHNLAIALRAHASCLVLLGRTDSGRAAAEESLALVRATENRQQELLALAGLAAVCDLGGDIDAAERHFLAADVMEFEDGQVDHLYSRRGVQWADFLLRTDRSSVAR